MVLSFKMARKLLYNGIKIKKNWPPKYNVPDSADREISGVLYLKDIPKIIPIDIGRQLFIDEFLIERTTLKRIFHKPIKYQNNPILFPKTKQEINNGHPGVCTFSDGVFYDPKDKLFKLYYESGWFSNVAMALSKDGINWERPRLNIINGTNIVVPLTNNLIRDGVSVWLDQNTKNKNERFKMFYYAREGEFGRELKDIGGFLLTSSDGIHWKWRGQTGYTKDNTTFFYNPFLKKWVFSHRSRDNNNKRIRSYWDNKNFLAALTNWKKYDPVFWAKADKLDIPDPKINKETQIYKIDAVAYESLMIGLISIFYGPSNKECAKKGTPKLTQLKVAFSRDGFHWDRRARDIFIGASKKKESWERGYISSSGGCFLVVGDKLFFYYGGFKGDEKNLNPIHYLNGMYSNSSIGLAVLRRDGFASMSIKNKKGFLITRPLIFKGKHLFVNVNSKEGELKVEILDKKGRVILPFTSNNCTPLHVDSTIQKISWKNNKDLGKLAGKPIKLRFLLKNGDLYSFWISKTNSGASSGYVAAGGPGFRETIDKEGIASYKRANQIIKF